MIPRDSHPMIPRDSYPMIPRDSHPMIPRDSHPMISRDSHPMISRDSHPMIPRDSHPMIPRDCSATLRRRRWRRSSLRSTCSAARAATSTQPQPRPRHEARAPRGANLCDVTVVPAVTYLSTRAPAAIFDSSGWAHHLLIIGCPAGRAAVHMPAAAARVNDDLMPW